MNGSTGKAHPHGKLYLLHMKWEEDKLFIKIVEVNDI